MDESLDERIARIIKERSKNAPPRTVSPISSDDDKTRRRFRTDRKDGDFATTGKNQREVTGDSTPTK